MVGVPDNLITTGTATRRDERAGFGGTHRVLEHLVVDEGELAEVGGEVLEGGVGVRSAEEAPEEGLGGGGGELEVEALEDGALHLEEVLPGVGVVGDVAKLVDLGGVDLLVLGRQEHARDADELELRLGDGLAGEEAVDVVDGEEERLTVEPVLLRYLDKPVHENGAHLRGLGDGEASSGGSRRGIGRGEGGERGGWHLSGHLSLSGEVVGVRLLAGLLGAEVLEDLVDVARHHVGVRAAGVCEGGGWVGGAVQGPTGCQADGEIHRYGRLSLRYLGATGTQRLPMSSHSSSVVLMAISSHTSPLAGACEQTRLATVEVTLSAGARIWGHKRYKSGPVDAHRLCRGGSIRARPFLGGISQDS